jgi:hypothetical protein
MRTFDQAFSRTLQDEDARKRVAPFLSEVFDPAPLARPTFLTEIGLEPRDGEMLKVGVVGQSWLTTAAFFRALAEELHERKENPEVFFNDYPAGDERKQWIVAQRVFLRMDQLINLSQDRTKVAAELQIPVAQLDAWRKSWRETMTREDQALSLAIQLRLLGVGVPPQKQLLEGLEAQTHSTFLWAFHADRPMLTRVSDSDVEVVIYAPSPLNAAKSYFIRESLAKEIQDNSHLSPLLWGKAWIDYLDKHKNFSHDEFRVVLDHLEQDGRNQWPDMVAGQGTRARRAVAALSVALLESLHSADDSEAIQRLFNLIENFSEHHDMKAVLKRRFNL